MTQRERTIEELRGHALELAEAFGVAIQWVDEMTDNDGSALNFGPIKIVFHKPIENEADYAGVLHEIGHCADALGTVRPDPRRASFTEREREHFAFLMMRERAAWEWAEHYAGQFGIWTAAMESVKTICLADYEAKIAQAKDARIAAWAARENATKENIGSFVDRAAADVPPPAPPKPRVSRGESIADFLERRRS